MYKTLKELVYSKEIDINQEYEQRFNSVSSQKLNLSIKSNFGKNYQLFYMNTSEMIVTIEKINKTINNRNQVSRGMVKGNMLNHYQTKLLFEELLATNTIEGVRSTRSELEAARASTDKTQKFFFLIRKYEKLTDDVTRLLNYSNPEHIRQDYDELLFNQIDSNELPDGNLFRKSSVSITSSDSSKEEIHRGVFGEENIISHLSNLIYFMDDHSIPMLIRIAVFHYYFGYIHPFYDGNGRLSRYISSLFLKSTYDKLVALKLSKVILENKKEYYDAFETVNHDHNKGDLTPFILMFIKMVERAAIETFREVSRYASLFDQYLTYLGELVEKKIIDELDLDILFIAFQSTLYKVKLSKKDICEELSKSNPTITKHIRKLVTLNLIKQTSRTDYKIPSTIMNSFEMFVH